ncbi:DUF1566 domain-containing protein [Stappia sp. TSB10GB4]|uniref:Lcl C-terminal domain-containing protein n=1 Tax=Stappia sp. TSB10GB4 TaxID=2003584 RepID=UPI001646BF0C|nr:DUF1566 domain-containing protein [Stappia sp. TSB10GB4]
MSDVPPYNIPSLFVDTKLHWLRLPTRMPDGTVYVGTSPNNGRPLYVMPEDLPGFHQWEYAMRCAPKQTFGGYNDWRIPTEEELNMLYHHRDTIGGFADGWYWSSKELWSSSAWRQHFADGTLTTGGKIYGSYRVRCVRSG